MRGRHKMQIIRLCIVVLIQVILVFDIHMRGMTVIVGIIIFSIGEDSGFVHNLFHRCLTLSLEGRGLGLLRMLPILVG